MAERGCRFFFWSDVAIWMNIHEHCIHQNEHTMNNDANAVSAPPARPTKDTPPPFDEQRFRQLLKRMGEQICGVR